MSTIVTRAGKGSPLTWNEVDNNFTNLNTDKFQSGSNISVGTLSASGVSTFSAGSAAAPAITTTGDTNTGMFFPAADTIAFSEGGTESMRIDSSGNLGLGVTPSVWNSGYKTLEFTWGAFSSENSTVGQALVTINAYNTGTATAPTWKYKSNGYATAYIQNASTAGHQWFTSAANASGAGAAVTFTQAMTLDASGNLGIGTASPTTKIMAYNGSSRTLIRAASDLNFSGAYLGTATATNRGASLELLTHANSTDAGGWKQQAAVDVTGNYDLTFSYAAPASTYAGLSYTERMRIDSAGNLGLGVTPSAWDSGQKVFQSGKGSFYGLADGGATIFSNNAYYNAGWKYATTNPAASYQQIQNAHSWYVAPSGTAGNAITFTQAMTLDANGKLIISRSGGTGLQAVGCYNTTVGDSANVNIQADGAMYRSSSARKYKKDIRDIEQIDLSLFKPIRYKSNCEVDDQTKDYFGFIADDYVSSYPELVQFGADDEVEGFRYDRMTVVLVKFVQEQQAMINELKAKVAALEAA